MDDNMCKIYLQDDLVVIETQSGYCNIREVYSIGDFISYAEAIARAAEMIVDRADISEPIKEEPVYAD